MSADVGVRHAGHQLPELGPAEVHEPPVVTGLEINVRCLHEAVIENALDAVGCAQWRHRARFAIAEQILYLSLGRKPKRAPEVPVQGAEVDLARGWHHRDDEALVVLQKRSFRKLGARDMRRLRRVRTCSSNSKLTPSRMRSFFTDAAIVLTGPPARLP